MPWVTFLVAVAVTFAVFSLCVEHIPRRTARAIDRVPGLRGLLLTSCENCDGPTILHGAEELPVDFPPETRGGVLTLRLCRRCSERMTAMDRIDLMNANADDTQWAVRMTPTEDHEDD